VPGQEKDCSIWNSRKFFSEAESCGIPQLGRNRKHLQGSLQVQFSISSRLLAVTREFPCFRPKFMNSSRIWRYAAIAVMSFQSAGFSASGGAVTTSGNGNRNSSGADLRHDYGRASRWVSLDDLVRMHYRSATTASAPCEGCLVSPSLQIPLMSLTTSSRFDPASFFEKVAEAISPAAPIELTPDCRLRDLGMWDSIASVSIVAMVYAEYDVQISGDELVACKTGGKLAALVASKLAALDGAS
jgi:acyl carrier protein